MYVEYNDVQSEWHGISGDKHCLDWKLYGMVIEMDVAGQGAGSEQMHSLPCVTATKIEPS